MEIADIDAATLWAMRQLLRGSELSAQRDRHEVEGELSHRMLEDGATKLPIGSSMYVTASSSTDWEYEAEGVNRLRDFLVGGGLVTEEEWNLAVKWVPKVNGHAVRRWVQLGGAVQALVDQARSGASGKPSWKGPELEEMQRKLPEVVAEAAGRL